MPRLFVDASQLAGEQISLRGEAHRYLTRVLRLAPGATLDLFDGRGGEVSATILRSGAREVTLALGGRRTMVLPTTPPVTLLQGLPRAERMDLVIQKATELGAARVVPVRTARTAAGQQARSDRWRKIATEAARQCGRADIPEIAAVTALEAAVAAVPADAARLLPWEEAGQARPLGGAIPARPPSLTVLIGPEGGLTSGEVDLATSAGFEVVTLGPRILRTETAAIVALALVQSRLGALG